MAGDDNFAGDRLVT